MKFVINKYIRVLLVSFMILSFGSTVFAETLSQYTCKTQCQTKPKHKSCCDSKNDNSGTVIKKKDGCGCCDGGCSVAIADAEKTPVIMTNQTVQDQISVNDYVSNHIILDSGNNSGNFKNRSNDIQSRIFIIISSLRI